MEYFKEINNKYSEVYVEAAELYLDKTNTSKRVFDLTKDLLQYIDELEDGLTRFIGNATDKMTDSQLMSYLVASELFLGELTLNSVEIKIKYKKASMSAEDMRTVMIDTGRDFYVMDKFVYFSVK